MSSSPDLKSAPNPTVLSRLEHFTWAWFCLPMSTGGIALLLSPATQPHTFPGLNTIGKTVYIIDLTIFTTLSLAIIYRFLRYRGTFTASLTHPTESLFAATFLLSLASIIACISRYGITSLADPTWLITTYDVLFWLYFGVTFIFAVGAYVALFTNPALKISDMTPAWDLPIFPFMLSGTLAASGAQHQPPDQAVPMIIAGITAQGLGFIMSILMYASYIRRMVQYGFPHATARPAMFIAVGPPAFTSLALLGMANAFPTGYINYFGEGVYVSDPLALDSATQQRISIHILRVMATFSSIFVWSLSFWFFAVAVCACILVVRQMKFHLNWWAFVFPNVGFTIATINIGKVMRSEGILWVGSIMSILIVCVWFFVAVHHIWAVWDKRVLWNGQDEDVYQSTRTGEKHADEEKQD